MKNRPDLWLEHFALPSEEGHKYDRGAAVIYGAPKLTGATRLAASACARLCGVTSVVAPHGVGDIYRTALPAHIMVEDLQENTPQAHVTDARRTSVLLGSGGGYDETFIRSLCVQLWAQPHLNGIVLDAEGFKAWGGLYRDQFAAQVARPIIVTPHQGEFQHVFKDNPDVLSGSREKQAQKAAKILKAIVVLKGAETVITDGVHVVVNNDAPSTLATAGSGDVLAGMITGLLAAGMPAFEAACVGVWIHSKAAQKCGLGLVASDLCDEIPNVLKDLLGIHLKVS